MKTFYDNLRRKKSYAYSVIFASAVVFTLSIQLFIQVSHTFTSGVSSLAMIPVLLDANFQPYMTLMYLVLNIPILILMWKKIKKDFLYKTIFFLVISASFGLLFIFDSISDPFKNLIVNPDNVLKDVWPIFIIGMIGGIFMGVAISMAWKYGGSSGGGDIISYYYSTNRKISVGLISFIVSMTFVFVSFVTTIIIDDELRSHSFVIILGTVIYVAVSSLTINVLYPRYSKIKVEIHSTKVKKISAHWKKNKFAHSWQIQKIRSGYTGKEKEVITTVILLLELKEIKKNLIAIDDGIWFSTYKVRNQFGKFNTSVVD